MSRTTKQIMISLDHDTIEKLDTMIDRYRIPKSNLITIALRQYFEREKTNANIN